MALDNKVLEMLEDARKYASQGKATIMESCLILAERYAGNININISDEVTRIRELNKI